MLGVQKSYQHQNVPMTGYVDCPKLCAAIYTTKRYKP